MKLLFICTGNTCRSPMAEEIMREIAKRRRIKIEIDSAGVLSTPGTPITDLAIKVLSDMGIEVTHLTSKLVSNEMIEQSDLILVMSEKHKQFFNQFNSDKIHTIGEFIGTDEEIKDPYGGDLSVYQDTAFQLYSALEKVMDILTGENLNDDTIHDVNIF